MPPLELFDGTGPRPASRSTWGGYVLLQRFWESVLRFPSSASEDAGLRPDEVDNLSLAIACILLDRMSPAELRGDPLLFGQLERSDSHWLLPARGAFESRYLALTRLWSWLARRLFRAGCLMPEPIRLVSGEIEVPRFQGEVSSGRLEVRAALHSGSGIPLWWGISKWSSPEGALEPLLAVSPTLVFGKSFPATAFGQDLPFNHNGQAAACFRGLERQMTRAAEGVDVLYPEDDLAGVSAREEVRDALGRSWTLFVSRDEDDEVLLGAELSEEITSHERWPRAGEISASSAQLFRRLKSDFAIESLPEWLRDGPPPVLESRAVFATSVALAAFLEASFVQTIIPDRSLSPESLRTSLLRIPVELASLRGAAELDDALCRQNQFAALVSRRLQAWLPG